MYKSINKYDVGHILKCISFRNLGEIIQFCPI